MMHETLMNQTQIWLYITVYLNCTQFNMTLMNIAAHGNLELK